MMKPETLIRTAPLFDCRMAGSRVMAIDGAGIQAGESVPQSGVCTITHGARRRVTHWNEMVNG